MKTILCIDERRLRGGLATDVIGPHQYPNFFIVACTEYPSLQVYSALVSLNGTSFADRQGASCKVQSMLAPMS